MLAKLKYQPADSLLQLSPEQHPKLGDGVIGESEFFDPLKVQECAESSNNPIGFHCNRMTVTNYGRYEHATTTIYACSNASFIEFALNRQSSNIICDGIQNCESGIDEQNCPQMFYCSSDMTPLPEHMICDSVPQCDDSSDECTNCAMSSYLSSENYLVGSPVIVILMVAQCVSILILNMYALKIHFQRLRAVHLAPFIIDRIQCLTLSIYDLMMSCYLVIILVKQVQYRGVYCVHDVTWRTSKLCKIAGKSQFAK